MSWHYSQALEAAYSAANSLDGALSAPWNTTSTQGTCSKQGKTTDASNPSQSGTTSQPLTDDHGAELLTWFRAVFPAKTSAQPEGRIEKGLPERAADFGQKWGESSGKYDRDSCSWKTRQHWLFGGLESCSENWPRWGMMRNGEWWPLPMLAHDTSVREYGSWPIIGTPIKTQRARSEAFTSPAKNPFELCPKGYLPNPSWVEGLMGWPDGWTDSNGSAMDKFRLWSQRHGIFSRRSE